MFIINSILIIINKWNHLLSKISVWTACYMEVMQNDFAKLPVKSERGRPPNRLSRLILDKKLTLLTLFWNVLTSSFYCEWFEKATELPLSVIHTSCSRDFLQPLVKMEYPPWTHQQDWRYSCLENVLAAAAGYLGECWKGKRSCHMLPGWHRLCAPDRRSTWDQILPPSSPCPLAYVENNIMCECDRK